MKIVIDAFGGDNAPDEIVEGAVIAINKIKDLELILVGDESILSNKLYGRNERISIFDAKEIISNDESPTEAIRKKADSSLVKAFDVLKQNEDVIALVSAGSTGAILTGAIMKIGRIKGISRPCLSPILPTRKDRDVMLVDSGANIDCKPIQLCHFALMGSAYYSVLYNEPSPRVSLLNIGIEEGKGNELIKESYSLLKSLPINFVGNMEAREYMSGDYDVVVTDGFCGNVLLKGVEGAVGTVMSVLKKSIKSRVLSMIGAVFMKGTFKDIKKKMDINKHGGSPFLGIKKLVIKNHGSSKRTNIVASIEQAILLHENKLIDKISMELSKISNIEVKNEN